MATMPRLQATGRGLRILIVSDRDDPAIAETSDNESLAVLWVSNLTEAQHAVATRHVDAILIDLELAQTAGRDIRQQLATFSLRLPVIVVLNDDAVVEVSDAIAIGADGFYYKRQLYPWLLDVQREPSLSDVAG